MPSNRGTRHKPKWVGHAEYKGRKKWVGTHDNIEDYRNAERQCLEELRVEVDDPARCAAPTVLEFAGATIHDDDRITMTWPDGEFCEKAAGRRDSTIRRARDGLGWHSDHVLKSSIAELDLVIWSIHRRNTVFVYEWKDRLGNLIHTGLGDHVQHAVNMLKR